MTGKSRILVVEDNERNRKLFRLLVEGMGHECLIAVDGEDGLLRIREDSPDLVLMDIQMPKLDGVAALARLREDPVASSIPVVAVTSHAMSGDRERLLAAGFAAYLPKPIDTEEFRRTVRSLLEQRHG